jgi:HlyD family secretion protein
MPIQINEKGRMILTSYEQLRGESFNEIISRKPSFLARWALLLFGGILLLIVTASWFIHYPETITAKATLTGTNAPKEIIPKQDGKLIKLFITNNDSVKQGGILGWIESNAKHEQVLQLHEQLNNAARFLRENKTEKITKLFENNYENLGELQISFQQFFTAYQQFSDYLINGFYLQKKKRLYEDLAWLQKMNVNINEQKKLQLQDLTLTQESYNANQSLLNDKVISQEDFRAQKSKLIGKQLTIPQLDANLLANETQQRDKQKEIVELEHTISLQKDIFQQTLQTLQSSVDDWMKKYLLIAPITGKVLFNMPLQENQFIHAGRSLGFVNPYDSRFYAEINLPQNNFGKIDTGQQVQLRLDAYPYNEFGVVKGKLQYISTIATDSGFVAYVQLNNGLNTNQHKELQYKSGLKAEALIVTKDMRLLQRLYYNTMKSIQQ